jgi:hypothetical protein
LGRDIDKYAFRDCSTLSSVIIGDSVTFIPQTAFAYCGSLTSVIIGNSVKSIDAHAFRDCESLTAVTIGNSVTHIGRDAFAGCSSLRSIHFLSTKPPYINNLYFDYASPTIYVPQESIEAYKSMFPWMSFNNIVGE